MPSRGSPSSRPAGASQASASPRRGDHRVGVEDPNQHQVDEEPLDAAFARRQLFVFEITADDAHVVRPIPACGARTPDELQPGGDRVRARRAGMAEGQRTSFADVAEQALVDRPPPWASRRRGVDRVEKSSPQLPSHERRRGLPVGKIAAVHVRWDPILAAHQGQPSIRVVPDGGDAGECDLAGRLPGHQSIVPIGADPTRASSAPNASLRA